MASSKKEVVVELRLEDRGAVQQLGELKALLVQQQTERNKLQATIRKGIALTNEEKDRLGQLGAATRNTSVKIRELENNLSGATSAGLRFRDKMADAAKAGLGAFGLNILSVTGAIAGLVSVFKDAFSTIRDFDQALANVAALGGQYAKSIDQIAEATKTVGIQFGFTAVQSVQAVEELAKAGVSVEDILGGALESTLQLAAAGTLEVGNAAELASISMTTFGLAGDDVVRVADSLTAGAQKALGSVEDLGNALKFVGPVAANLGVSLEETVGALALFAQSGVKGEQAGTSLRGVLSALTSPSEQAAKELERLGIVTANGNALFDEATGKFLGLKNLAGQLANATRDLTEEQRAEALGRIFGNQQLTAANILYKGGAEAVAEWTKNVTDSGVAAETAAAKQDSLDGSLNKLSASYDALILNGGAVSSVLQKIVDSLTLQIDAAANASSAWEAFGALFNQQFALTLAFQQRQAKALAEQNKPFDATALSVEELTARLEKLTTLREAFISQGKFLAAVEGDAEIAQIKEALATKQAAQAAAAKAQADAEAAAATANRTKATDQLTAAQRRQLEQELALKKQIAALPAGKDALAKPQQDQGIAIINPDNFVDVDAAKAGFLRLQAAQEEFRLLELEGIVTFNDERKLLDAEYYDAKAITQEEFNARSAEITRRFELQQAQAQKDLIASAANTLGDIASLAKQGSAEYKALAIAQTLINTYLGATAAFAAQQIPGDPTSLPRGIAAAALAIISGLINVAKIQGFATGGKITDGKRIRRDNGDDVLITAKRGEVIMNEPQQQRARQLYGDDFFRRIGVPGFAAGGVLQGSRGTALVNFPSVPRPSPTDIVGIEAAAEARATQFSAQISVVEINRVQNRARVIEQLSTA